VAPGLKVPVSLACFSVELSFDQMFLSSLFDSLVLKYGGKVGPVYRRESLESPLTSSREYDQSWVMLYLAADLLV